MKCVFRTIHVVLITFTKCTHHWYPFPKQFITPNRNAVNIRPQPLVTCNLLPETIYSRYCMPVEPYNICSFVSGLSHFGDPALRTGKGMQVEKYVFLHIGGYDHIAASARRILFHPVWLML